MLEPQRIKNLAAQAKVLQCDGYRIILDAAEKLVREAGAVCQRVVLVGSKSYEVIIQAAVKHPRFLRG